MKIFIFVLTFALVALEEGFAAPGPRSLPKDYIKCKRSEPNFSGCVQNAVEQAFQKMKSKGIPSLGILPLDPLDVEGIKMRSGSANDPVNLRIDFKNMKIHGVANTLFKDYKINLEDNSIDTVSTSPLVWFDSEYNADGKILILPVKGQGIANFTMHDLECVSHLGFKPEERNGDIYWVVEKFDVRFQPKKMNMYFTGLLSQDKTLGEGINTFINENWEVVYESLRSEFEEAFGAIFKEIANRVFTKVPINKIFLE